jgi:hypothetical protein
MSADPQSAPRRLTSLIGGAVSLLFLLGVGLIVVSLGSRTALPQPSGFPPPAAAVGAVSTQAVEPTEAATASPSPTVEPTAEVTPEPTTAPTPEPPAATPRPTTEPTAEPTARPTAKPTPKPTPKPTHDPTPEGTPRITTKSGSFGQALTVQGIEVRVAKTAAHEGALNCVTDDPDRQGWTEVVSYELTMTWPDAGDAEEPWFAVGGHPWNVLQFDGPSPFKSGADYVVTTCHRPSDSDKVKVEISPPGSPLIYYRWFFD